MKRSAILLVLACAFLLPAVVPAQAQGEGSGATHFSILEMDLRPEFDTPDMLVIYHIVLSSDTQLPAQVSIRLPARVSEPNAVAWVDPADGGMYNLDYQTRSEGDWNVFTFSTTGPEVNFEYYDPALSRVDNVREYNFEWLGDFQVDDFRFFLLLPQGAKNAVITPDLGAAQTDDQGSIYYTKALGAIPVGNAFKIKLSYQRDTNSVSAVSETLAPSGPLDSTTQGRMGISELLPWLAGLLLLILAGFIGWWIWLSRKTAYPEGRKSHSRPERKTPPSGEEVLDQVYCHQCGERAGKSDIFCRSCGIRLRRE